MRRSEVERHLHEFIVLEGCNVNIWLIEYTSTRVNNFLPGEGVERRTTNEAFFEPGMRMRGGKKSYRGKRMPRMVAIERRKSAAR